MNMKNIYVAPKAEQINILTEGAIMAASLAKNNGTTIDTSVSGSQLSQKRGWSSDSWTAEDEE